MGKKKSVVLIILVTIVLVGLLFISVTPTFPVKSPYNFRSLLSIVDLGSDLGGGYSVVYYPEGVISAEQYEGKVAQYEELKGTEDEISDPSGEYVAHGGVYLSQEILEGEEISETFLAEFDSAYAAVRSRFEGKNFTEYSVKLQDDYTIVVNIPDVSEKESVSTLFNSFSYSGSLLFTDDAGNEMAGTSENIKSAGVVGSGDSGYAIVINFTKAGRAAFSEMTGAMVNSSSDSSSSSSATMYIRVGDNDLVANGISVTSQLDQDAIYISGSYSTRESAETVACMINSVLNEDAIFTRPLTVGEIYSYGPTMGENAALIMACVVGVAILTMIVVSLVRYKGMGLAHVFGFLTYALALILCISLIDGIIVNIAGLLAIVLSAAVMCAFNFYAFRNIREEFNTGKTLTAAIKSGYRKSLALTIDAHIVLFLASLVIYLIALGAAQYMALIFMLGTVLSAACTLAVTRFYFYMFLAQPKNKIAFCNFKREETEDE